ncbi:hypothetical protein [Cupriavidus lacunae]|uniref:hypothetical protein n=1 Tax=Cupriavidus lacunae TaxID=2666307 RepID=UPI001058B6C5|nr:hypothetical protein [Cupriavidus lacunae]
MTNRDMRGRPKVGVHYPARGFRAKLPEDRVVTYFGIDIALQHRRGYCALDELFAIYRDCQSLPGEERPAVRPCVQAVRKSRILKDKNMKKYCSWPRWL